MEGMTVYENEKYAGTTRRETKRGIRKEWNYFPTYGTSPNNGM